MKKDLISIGELSPKEILDTFTLTEKIKKSPGRFSLTLKAKTLALVFEKPSNRTYVSFSVGMYQLGGNSIYLGPEQIKLGVRETIHDVAKTLSRYCDGIVLRTFGHENVLEMARFATSGKGKIINAVYGGLIVAGAISAVAFWYVTDWLMTGNGTLLNLADGVVLLNEAFGAGAKGSCIFQASSQPCSRS